MHKIRVGVVGLRHGMASVLEVCRDERFELVALCSHARETYDYLLGAVPDKPLDSVTFTAPREQLIAQSRALRDFSQVAFYDDYARLLAHPGLEAVILAVPINLNATYASAALECGKHVMASKPFAVNLVEGMRLLDVARRARAAFVLNFEFRQSPLVRRVRAELDERHIGELRMMWWNAFRMPFRPGYRQRAVSGGAFVAEICHWINLFSLFNDEHPFSRLCSFGGLDVLGGQQDFEDNAVTLIEYENGVRASLNFSYFTDYPRHNLFGLVGANGKLVGDTDGAGRLQVYDPAHPGGREVVVDAAEHEGHLGFDLAHRRFADIVLQGRRVNESEAGQGFENLVTCLAAQRSLEQGRVVTRNELLAG
ncbi:Gfo/Idh/MocA family protein [Variovorax sp. OV329]|uniref:Gfo/Idh/MocA family protein n=1 Tax=Variovorax sp. OV329 TaxID=1882825 RepID=UPI0008F1FD97|nr:Gfo/Idh/MocA family oxidoreductase [Variovorax sp. OV329]SFN52413.1 Predicted dehydrogenase [Variovorax sp. OV329]